MNLMKKTALVALTSLGLAAAGSATIAPNGQFDGTRVNAYYGYVKVVAIVKNGKLVDVQIVEAPNHANRSAYISNVALPYLIQEAVSAQSARVNLISGATMTSQAFVQSLDAALKKAGA